MIKNRYFRIVKYVICDLSGTRCGEDHPIDVSVIPDCSDCDYYKEAQNEVE